MKISCDMAEDLLPLYVEDVCSEDSRAALEEHMNACPGCREKCRRMRSENLVQTVPQKDVDLTTCARKVRRQRICSVLLFVGITILSTVILTLVCLTFEDMYNRLQVYEVEEGIWNLKAGALETKAENVDQYILYTNSTQIAVTMTSDGDFSGTVKLLDTANPEDFVAISDITREKNTVTFTNLSEARRYIVSCEDMDGASVIVSEGRNSLLNVIKSLSSVFH